MNFFDAYDVPGTTTPPANSQPQPSLNEEVTQVVGQLSRFWGGFRKQSQTALESARKDFGSVVQQAQKEFTKLAEGTPLSPSAPEPSASAAEQTASIPAEAAEAASIPSTSTDAPETSDKAAPEESASTSQPQTLFSRLQASLPPSLVTTVQTQLPDSLKETLKHARVGSANLTALDFAQLRTTITSELQRVQGVTEEYVHRSEEFLRDAGEFLKDAVKVVPPEEGDGYSGLIWDGTDVWMLPNTSGTETPGASSNKGKEKEREVTSSSSGRPQVDTLRAVATRAESMLKQLRHDPAVIKVDPKDDENIREMYTNWLATEAESDDRGTGTTAWQNKVERALADPVDGSALKATLDTLVPELMTQDEFWTRYFFRVYQVEREEARRKAIIQGTTENEEDFSWEDDDEDPTSPTAKQTSLQADSAKSAAHLSAPAPDTKSRTSTPGNQSPRQSSEDSYDVVSSQVSSSGAAETATLKPKPEEASDDQEESDEEDEEDEDEEDEDEDEEDEDEEGEEEDSDWE